MGADSFCFFLPTCQVSVSRFSSSRSQCALLAWGAVEWAWTQWPARCHIASARGCTSRAQEAVEWPWHPMPHGELRKLWNGPGPEHMPERLPERMPDRMSEKMPDSRIPI